MKNFNLLKILLVTFILLIISAVDTFASQSSPDYKEISNATQKYDKLNLLDSVSYKEEGLSSDFPGIVRKLMQALFIQIKSTWRFFAEIVIVCIISSLLTSLITNKDLSQISGYACYCICAYLMISSFKLLSNTCIEAIRNVTDYMKILIPTYASAVAGCGYVSTASGMQSIFMIISLFISDIISKFIFPLLYYCGLLTSVNGISSSINFSRMINLISKIIKYATGVIMTVFAGIIGFSGMASGAGDNVAVKTIKYTVSNFVPVVGTCLSDALNSIVSSSLALKNAIGYIGFLVLISLCIIPVIKIGFSIVILRLCASVADLFSQSNFGVMIDSVCDVLSTMVSMLIFIIAVFVLIIGVLVSIG